MAPVDQRPPKKRDRTNENFDKATTNLLSRCDQIRQRYGADVYIQVRRGHKHYEYTSSNEPSWPKTKAEMVSTVVEQPLKANISKERTYPIPVTRTPTDFARRQNCIPASRPSCTIPRPRGIAAGPSDAQQGNEERSAKVDSRKVPVQVQEIIKDHCDDPTEQRRDLMANMCNVPHGTVVESGSFKEHSR
ncbi:hypothetical protein LZ32DRAFT_134554 [Colletotrichum eremochloae]|nr:hypothetical protein LZ32DRAFT_134554 [Colletotrichum eremochloae]